MTAKRIQHGPPTAKKKGVCMTKIQGARQCCLKSNTALTQPIHKSLRALQCDLSKMLICYTLGNSHEIFPIFFKTVTPGHNVGWLIMHHTQITRVACIATTHITRRRVYHQHRTAAFGSRDGRTNPRIAAANYDNIPAFFNNGFRDFIGHKTALIYCIQLHTI